MKADIVIVRKYVADEGKVFDWAEPHYTEDEVREHLYVKFLFLGKDDDISNYVEVEEEMAANEDTE